MPVFPGSGLPDPAPTLSFREWRVLLLLFLSGVLNYVDRANLSVGAIDIQRELHLSTYQLGLLLSAFFWTYALVQLCTLAGWVADRFHVCWILAGGFFLWSGATALSGMAATFAMLFGLRLVLGVGESIAYPSYARILATGFAEHQRGFANAIIDAGTKLGPAVGALSGGLLMARYGWRPFFVILGASTLLWLAPWIAWMPRGRVVEAQAGTGDEPGAFALFCDRSVLFSALGLFCSNYFWYFLVTWLPAYLETGRHFAKARMAVWASLAFLTVAVSSTVFGWISDRLIRRGHTPTLVRKSFAGVGLTLCTLIVPVALVRDARVSLGLLLVTCVSYGLFSPNLWAITQTLAGPRVAGRWTSVQNGVGNLAGVAGPWLTGWVVERTGQFFLAFVVAARIVLAGAVVFVFGIGPIKTVEIRGGNKGLKVAVVPADQ